jgi:rhodanese-related sulfurtransferase
MKHWIFLGALLFFLATGATAYSDEKYKTLTAPEVKEMIEGGRAIAIHVLSRIEFEMQHIPGSINIPITEMNETDKLPKEKAFPLIFYCMGLK